MRALAVLPPPPPIQQLLRPRREFVEVELVIPVLAWETSGLRPPRRSPVHGRQRPRRPRFFAPVPGAIPLRFHAPVHGKAKSVRPNKLQVIDDDAPAGTRRCSECKKPGHNRRTCLKLFPFARPVTRADCKNGIRPCPFVTCTRHLAYDVTDSGSLKTNFPGVALEDMEETCADDVSDQGPQTLVRVGRLFNVKTQRADQMVQLALGELAAKLDACGLAWPAQIFGERPADLDDLDDE